MLFLLVQIALLLQVTVTVSHFKMLGLGDHMESFLAAEVIKLPLLEPSLLCPLLLLLGKFQQLHAGSSHFERVLNRSSTVGGRSVILGIDSLSADGCLQNRLIRTLLLAFLFFGARL